MGYLTQIVFRRDIFSPLLSPHAFHRRTFQALPLIPALRRTGAIYLPTPTPLAPKSGQTFTPAEQQHPIYAMMPPSIGFLHLGAFADPLRRRRLCLPRRTRHGREAQFSYSDYPFNNPARESRSNHLTNLAQRAGMVGFDPSFFSALSKHFTRREPIRSPLTAPSRLHGRPSSSAQALCPTLRPRPRPVLTTSRSIATRSCIRCLQSRVAARTRQMTVLARSVFRPRMIVPPFVNSQTTQLLQGFMPSW